MSKAQLGALFPKSGNIFLPSCGPVSVAEYASISLNTPKHPWKWLGSEYGLWKCQGSEYACSSYVQQAFENASTITHKISDINSSFHVK